MVSLFLASSPMNILKCLVLINNGGVASYLIIETFDSGATMTESYNRELKEKIENLNIQNLRGVRIVDSNSITFLNKIVGKYLIEDIDLHEISRFYSANVWTTGISPYTRLILQTTRFDQNVKFSILEDGTKMYLGDFSSISKKSIKRIIKEKFLSDIDILKSTRVSEWIVETPENYSFVYRPVNTFSLSNFHSDVQKFSEIFLSVKDIHQLKDLAIIKTNKQIIFTQPLFKSGLVESIEVQEKIVNQLLNKYYVDGSAVYLKVHPADTATYKNLDVPIKVLGNYPSEILDAFNISFSLSLGFFSSAVESVNSDIYIYDVTEYNKYSSSYLNLDI